MAAILDYDQNDFSYFWSLSHPDASYHLSSQLAQGCRRSRTLKQLLTPYDARPTMHDGHWLTTIAHHENFVLRYANKWQHHLSAVYLRYKVTLGFRNTLLFCDLLLEKKNLDESDNSP